MKILNVQKLGFDRQLDQLLSNRKNKINSSNVSVGNIIKDVKKWR